MAQALTDLPQTLKLLADPVRLRLCALLSRAELAVHELMAITGLQQSRISNHLSRLKRAGLVRDRREGTWSFHSLAEPGHGPLSCELFAATVAPSLTSREGVADQQALQAVQEQRRLRSREAHDELAERWSDVGQAFAHGTLRAELLAQAFPCGARLADLGCGTGFLGLWLAARGAAVIAVDHSERMLATARANAAHLAIEFRTGELDDLPLQHGEVDAALCNLVWHHLADYQRAAEEMFRAVAPGGVVVVADLLAHDCEWMRITMGDLRLGLRPEQVVAALARAGFVGLRTEPACDRYRVRSPQGELSEFPMFFVVGRKPRDGASFPAS